VPNWVVWKLEKRANKRGEVHNTKPPYNSVTGKHAESDNPATWSSFEASKSAYERGGYDGVGFCLTGRFIGIDLDGCRPDGKTDEPWAAEIIRELGSYTEVSPSGKGIRIIVTGELPDGGRQKEFKEREHYGIGLYDAARGSYLTITGASINGNAIQERTAELRRIHERLFPPKAKSQTDTGIGDEELIERALKAKDGGKFARLWAGQWEGEYPSQSEADVALCMKLAFWTGRDAERIDTLFRRSGLMRDKWNREDYRTSTIARAIERTTDTWKPPKPKPYTVRVDLNLAKPSLDLLNAIPLFLGKIQFAWLRRRGSMIEAGFADASECQWPTATDLRTFARSQDILFGATGILMASPPLSQIKQIWEPIAQLIRTLADGDSTDIEPPLRDEFLQIIRATWERAGRPQAWGGDEFYEMLHRCVDYQRCHTDTSPPRCCVWVGGAGEQAEQFTWIYMDSLVTWLSTPAAKGKHYPWQDVRIALLMLDFKPIQLHRMKGREHVNVRLWKGPHDLLIDPENLPETEI
jgi:hypothetical protein